MPDGTLTIDIEIKILPSVMTAVHESTQDGAGAQRDCVLCHRTSKNTGTDFFGDMVDNFVDIKLGSILIVFQDGEQKCHAFPLIARNAFLVKIFILFISVYLKAKRQNGNLPVDWYGTGTYPCQIKEVSEVTKGQNLFFKFKQ
jgi:hypothetical protein